MKNNATINTTLGALLDALEARAIINIFVEKDGGEEQLLVNQFTVYQAYDLPYWVKLKSYKVTGLSIALNLISIRVKQEG